jgi:two-component system sensor histidine kinase RpfC
MNLQIKGQLSNPEFQSAIVRLAIWLFMLFFIGLGASTGYYPVPMEQYYTLFILFFILFVSILISVLIKPTSVTRQYIGLIIDIAATSYSIVLSQNAISPIFLFYIWIFVSYGTRYGREHLIVATLASLFSYAAVVTHLGGWKSFAFEAYFFLFFMALLPIYQGSLIKRLHLARQEAEQATRARGRFLATMTHEIRTPLSGIIGMARVMETDNLNNLQKEQLSAIRMSADKLEMLIGDILDFSRIDAEKLELHSKPFDAAAIVFDICRSLAIQSSEKGLELYCTIEGEFPATLVGDQLRFSQIVTNLIGNAIKFTDRGEIEVTLSYTRKVEPVTKVDDEGFSLSSGFLVLRVADTGVGISGENLKAIFDPFHQVDNTSSRRYGGAGLGMAISHNLVELMNGRIDVDSQHGQGTTFSVILPLPVNSSRSMEILTLPMLNLLVLEADPVYLKQVQKMASDNGMNVRTMQTAGQLKNLSRGDHFDLMLIGETGHHLTAFSELAGLVETIIGYPPPLVAMTYPGRVLPADLVFAGHLKKPFSEQQFIETISSSLQLDKNGLLNSQPQTGRESGRQRHILVAEDDSINASLITTLLRAQGHEFTIVEDGYAALHAIRNGGYDLAFIDLRMPYLDGIELANLVRKEPEPVGNLPLIALTANASQEARHEALQAGMNEFLVKPISPDLLEEVVNRFAR